MGKKLFLWLDRDLLPEGTIYRSLCPEHEGVSHNLTRVLSSKVIVQLCFLFQQSLCSTLTASEPICAHICDV